MDNPKRMKLQSADGAQLNLDALYQIAPSCFTEATDPKTGKIKRMVNFDTLRQLLGDDAVEDAPEAYEFNWVGKQAARAEVLRPINKTLRPVKEDSVDWDNTQNLYIEGDNLEVLKLLQKSYLGKVKMIYIDPPYNTGNDFVYHDDFAQTQTEYDEASGAVDELGNRYWKNADSNGKYHSDWCSMIYSRLMVARSLLSEDGVIFISIDDNEVENLKKICNEVFGENNYVNTFAWINNLTGRQISGKGAAKTWETILVYAKYIDNLSVFNISIKFAKDSMPDSYKGFNKDLRKDEHGLFAIGDTLYNHNRKFNEMTRPNLVYSIFFNPKTEEIRPGNIGETIPDFIEILPHTNGDGVHKFHAWRWSKQKVESESYNLIVLPTSKGGFEIYTRIRDFNTTTLKDVITNISNGDSEVQKIFDGNKYFDYPKSVSLLKVMLGFLPNDSTILDFFSGSATTAHAVMQLNAEDGGNRKFIMVQLPEETPEDSEAFKAGYKNICEIGKERIRRAGKKIKEENPLTTQDLDTGFRVFRVESSNYEEVEHAPKDWNQDQLDLFLNNIKSDRTDLDLLFGCMLDWGVQLSLPMASEEVDGKMIYTVNDGDLVACFAEKVTDKVVKAMADKQPLRVIFRDSCFERDADKINIYETFKQLLDWSDQEVVKNIRVI